MKSATYRTLLRRRYQRKPRGEDIVLRIPAKGLTSVVAAYDSSEHVISELWRQLRIDQHMGRTYLYEWLRAASMDAARFRDGDIAVQKRLELDEMKKQAAFKKAHPVPKAAEYTPDNKIKGHSLEELFG